MHKGLRNKAARARANDGPIMLLTRDPQLDYRARVKTGRKIKKVRVHKHRIFIISIQPASSVYSRLRHLSVGRHAVNDHTAAQPIFIEDNSPVRDGPRLRRLYPA